MRLARLRRSTVPFVRFLVFLFRTLTLRGLWIAATEWVNRPETTSVHDGPAGQVDDSTLTQWFAALTARIRRVWSPSRS